MSKIKHLKTAKFLRNYGFKTKEAETTRNIPMVFKMKEIIKN